MQRPYHFILYDLIGEVFCVRLLQPRIEDRQMDEFGAELARLIDEENCRKMVLNLGPAEPECLISVFLAKLINLQRRLEGMNGALTLAHASDYTRNIFRIAGIERFFHFYPDQNSAVQALNPPA
ncbi:MAG: STAS domain-containing protein [Planctomycetes bacterium]|nr:STAS domain-containing protein [Planctomycetota bacterium]